MEHSAWTWIRWYKIGGFAALLLVATALAAWASALAGIAFVSVNTEVEIDAPRAAVWTVTTDFDRYPEWNPSSW